MAHARNEPLRFDRQPEISHAAERRRFIKAARRAPLAGTLRLVLSLSGGGFPKSWRSRRSVDLGQCVANIQFEGRSPASSVKSVLAACSTNSITVFIYAAANAIQILPTADLALEPTTAWRRSRKSWRRRTSWLPNAKGVASRFGVTPHCPRALPLLKRWMGHASIRSTEIDLDVMGPESAPSQRGCGRSRSSENRVFAVSV